MRPAGATFCWHLAPSRIMNMLLRRINARAIIVALAIIVASAVAVVRAVPPQAPAQNVEWRAYAASNAGTKYSALDQINRDNVRNLRIAWRQSAVPGDLARLGAN